MHYIALFVLAVFGMLHSSLALVDARERTDVDVSANAWDMRTSGDGCSPNGCLPDLTRDENLGSQSRWSCRWELQEETCQIWYRFDEPQDIVELCIALWRGDERVRKLKITIYDSDGNTTTMFYTSSGNTENFEYIQLNTDETVMVCLEPCDLPNDEWLSILETEFLVE